MNDTITPLQVLADLPAKTEVVLYTGLSAIQKKYYKAILMKDLGKPNHKRLYPQIYYHTHVWNHCMYHYVHACSCLW